MRDFQYYKLEAYLGWVTLGPGLVEGGWLLRLIGQAPVNLGSLVRQVAAGPFAEELWSTAGLQSILPAFFRFKREKGIRRRDPYLGHRFIDSAEALIEEVSGGDEDGKLTASYLLGILNARNPWDIPECTSSAVNLVLSGVGDHFYADRLRDIMSIMDEAVRAASVSTVVQRWAAQERRLREDLAPGGGL